MLIRLTGTDPRAHDTVGGVRTIHAHPFADAPKTAAAGDAHTAGIRRQNDGTVVATVMRATGEV